MIIEILMLISAAIIFIIVTRKYPTTEDIISQQKISPASHSSASNRLSFISDFIGRLRLRLRTLLLTILKKIDRRQSKTLAWPEEDPLKLADRAFSQKLWDEAEKYYIKSAVVSPKDPRIYSRLGVIYLEKKNYRDAKEALMTALAQDDTVATRHYNLAIAYSGLGDRKKAIISLGRALELGPGNEKYKRLKEKLSSPA